MGDARVLVTTPELYRRKVNGLRTRLPGRQLLDWTASAPLAMTRVVGGSKARAHRGQTRPGAQQRP